ncbi:hypothetical protein Mterra_03111 [Calidithermus terrae]|uniref:Uncharacterized protein n=1 Tax=Calidithermus terrae TaxID=1408545 RepID=A0A399EC42_9DEIN|nr:hypothetical protein Mterra_03111 [Calidithermus terrae]
MGFGGLRVWGSGPLEPAPRPWTGVQTVRHARSVPGATPQHSGGRAPPGALKNFFGNRRFRKVTPAKPVAPLTVQPPFLLLRPGGSVWASCRIARGRRASPAAWPLPSGGKQQEMERLEHAPDGRAERFQVIRPARSVDGGPEGLQSHHGHGDPDRGRVARIGEVPVPPALQVTHDPVELRALLALEVLSHQFQEALEGAPDPLARGKARVGFAFARYSLPCLSGPEIARSRGEI